MADAAGKKPGLMLAMLGGPKKVPDAPASDAALADEPESDGMSEDFDSAAQNAFDALQENDVAGFKLAFKAAVMACHDSDY